jgi:hypothetical protein
MNSKAHVNDVVEAPLYDINATGILYIQLFSEIHQMWTCKLCTFHNRTHECIY